jgi:hypothetical protein
MSTNFRLSAAAMPDKLASDGVLAHFGGAVMSRRPGAGVDRQVSAHLERPGPLRRTGSTAMVAAERDDSRAAAALVLADDVNSSTPGSSRPRSEEDDIFLSGTCSGEW